MVSLTVKGVRIYHTGDSDHIPENDFAHVLPCTSVRHACYDIAGGCRSRRLNRSQIVIPNALHGAQYKKLETENTVETFQKQVKCEVKSSKRTVVESATEDSPLSLSHYCFLCHAAAITN